MVQYLLQPTPRYKLITVSTVSPLICELQVSLDDQAFNKQQTLRYVKGYAHQAPEMTVLDPPAMAGTTDMYRAGTYNPATYTNSVSYSGSPTLRGSGNSETLPEWVVNNNKARHLARLRSFPALLLMVSPTYQFATFSIVYLQVLRWYGYFKEAVTESPTENHRVRKVVVLFYLEDNSCQVVEPKEDNSGIPQVNTYSR